MRSEKNANPLIDKTKELLFLGTRKSNNDVWHVLTCPISIHLANPCLRWMQLIIPCKVIFFWKCSYAIPLIINDNYLINFVTPISWCPWCCSSEELMLFKSHQISNKLSWTLLFCPFYHFYFSFFNIHYWGLQFMLGN